MKGKEENAGGCAVDPSTEKWLSAAATLLGLEVSELRLGLTSRVMQPTRGGALGTLIQSLSSLKKILLLECR